MRMFRVESEAARGRWIENYGEEDGSSTGKLETGKAVDRTQDEFGRNHFFPRLAIIRGLCL
jgi:hypothetical protein